eukprot:CAMPEP_0202820128 /NCGR_PEP_ID=MMETSP1389-20130828/9519_1 /ASSEMBLY_ACC=CAM_ASM_000865 /TAXON_ID=302021 /ORGANISM="Rhodomonas sp., Strain CCMP768" /LENGTH=47 /DNA_ID= /DNA_START= /DNA_END= /DNA_ORIENTATION=
MTREGPGSVSRVLHAAVHLDEQVHPELLLRPQPDVLAPVPHRRTHQP